MGRDGLQLRFTGEFPEEILDQTCKKIEDMGLQEKLRKEEATQIQRELIQVPEFAELYQALCAQGVEVSVIHTMLQSARSYQEHLSTSRGTGAGGGGTDLKPSLKFEYMKHYQPLVRYEEEEQAVADNLDTFPVLEWQEISPLTEHQRSMMRLPFLGTYLFNWHDHERKAVELLEQNLPLQKILMMNYVWGVELFLDADSLKNLKWLQMPDVEKFRRLMEAFEYDAEDLSEFWTLWLENRAGQYDVEWWLSQLLPISKERRQKILQSRLSYLNALYAGCLHINFEQVEYFQVQLLIYAVEHKKKHFLNLVNQNSELFFSLGRYSLLFVSGFCERCNLNSLTVKNLKDSDSIERTTSYFELLEEGQQYTFEELRLLWHQEEVYVRLYAKLSPLSVDQRMLTIRQLIKRDLVSQNIGDEALEQATQCLLEKPFGAWYEKDFRAYPGTDAADCNAYAAALSGDSGIYPGISDRGGCGFRGQQRFQDHRLFKLESGVRLNTGYRSELGLSERKHGLFRGVRPRVSAGDCEFPAPGRQLDGPPAV